MSLKIGIELSSLRKYGEKDKDRDKIWRQVTHLSLHRGPGGLRNLGGGDKLSKIKRMVFRTMELGLPAGRVSDWA